MVKTDNLYFDAQDRLTSGIDKIARAVGGTMGTGGNNANIEAIESPGHLMTNDGETIISSIFLGDPIEQMGRNMLLEAIKRANKASGDGSSTTCVLTASTIKEGLNYKDVHPMDIKRSLEECIPLIEKSLDEQTVQIVDEKQGLMDLVRLEQVASISAEDPEIGKTIAEIYQQIGKDGIIHWDISKTVQDTYTIGSGIKVEGAGYFSPYMCDADDAGRNTGLIRLKNPHILITKQKITSGADFEYIASHLHTKGVRDIVVFCDEVEPLVMSDIVITRMQQGFRIILVKLPVLWKDWWFEDLAKVTGATIVDPTAGLPMKNLREEHLGHVGNIVISKDETDLDGIKDVTDHIKALEEDGTDDSKLRASRLNTHTARYFVGAQSDSALSYRRLKVEDAISAAWQALNGGIVAGGGAALRNAAEALPDTVGGKILKKSLLAPIKQIMANAGATDDDQKSCLIEGGVYAYNTKTREVVDMLEVGITDPRNVVLNAAKNAISVAASVITAPTIITLPRAEEPQGVSPRNLIQN